MKLKSLLFILCISVFGNIFAANVHINPKADAADKKSIAQLARYPSYCQIELINDSFTDLYVYGTFDDGVLLILVFTVMKRLITLAYFTISTAIAVCI